MHHVKAWRPTPALLIAILALTVALSGTAYAALAKNSVGSGQVKNNSLKGKDIKDDKLTGADVKEETLGTVPNANALDGIDSTTFATRTAQPGELMLGDWGMWGGPAGSWVEDTVNLRAALPVAIPAARITYLNLGDAPTAQCPGTGQVVPRGWLCVYTNTQSSVTGLNGYNGANGNDDTSLQGFGLYGTCNAPSCLQYGSWALRVGSAADVAAPRPAPQRAANPG